MFTKPCIFPSQINITTIAKQDRLGCFEVEIKKITSEPQRNMNSTVISTVFNQKIEDI